MQCIDASREMDRILLSSKIRLIDRCDEASDIPRCNGEDSRMHIGSCTADK
jgi:hypothetical protein